MSESTTALFDDPRTATRGAPGSPRRAMVLAAGIGIRMRPLTDRMPKPLVNVGGRALIDHVLDRLAEAGVERAVVNVHHFADQIERHLACRVRPQIIISDERERLLDTGGGIVNSLATLGGELDRRRAPESLPPRRSLRSGRDGRTAASRPHGNQHRL